MRALEDHGLDFSSRARETLREVLGQTAVEPFLILLGKEAFHDPRLFAERASKFLGGGSLSVCNVIATRAIEDIQGSRLLPAVGEFESNMSHFEWPAKVEPETKKLNPIHDHRIRDQLDTYAEDA